MPSGVYVRTEETRAKMSRARKLKWQDPEYREKISQAAMGNKRTLGRHRTEEEKARIRQGNLGKYVSEEARANMRKAQLGKVVSEETKARLRVYWLGRHHTEETKSKKRLWWLNKTDEEKAEFIRVNRQSMHIRPNNPEMALLGLLESLYPRVWKYVGGGQLVVAGKNPDFWNGDHKLVELYGDWWHRGEDSQERIDLFSQEGYETLIIWERELKDLPELTRRVREFVG